DARVGLHRIGVLTPLGIPDFQPFAVSADPETTEHEPNDRAHPPPGQPAVLPATLLGTIDRPGDVDHFPFQARAGQHLVFQVLAPSVGSQLRPLLPLLDPAGNVLVKAGDTAPGGTEPVLTYTARADAALVLQVADADSSGSGAHFYRIAAGAVPYVHSVFPLG